MRAMHPPTPMESPTPLLVKVSRVLAGTVFIAVGLAGLFLPILPGWLLIIAGLAMLARDFPWARRLLDQVKARWSAARATARRTDQTTEDDSESRAA